MTQPHVLRALAPCSMPSRAFLSTPEPWRGAGSTQTPSTCLRQGQSSSGSATNTITLAGAACTQPACATSSHPFSSLPGSSSLSLAPHMYLCPHAKSTPSPILTHEHGPDLVSHPLHHTESQTPYQRLCPCSLPWLCLFSPSCRRSLPCARFHSPGESLLLLYCFPTITSD